MNLLAGGIAYGQAVALVILCVSLIVFTIIDVYLVLFLRRRNKKLAKNVEISAESEYDSDGTSTDTNESINN